MEKDVLNGGSEYIKVKNHTIKKILLMYKVYLTEVVKQVSMKVGITLIMLLPTILCWLMPTWWLSLIMVVVGYILLYPIIRQLPIYDGYYYGTEWKQKSMVFWAGATLIIFNVCSIAFNIVYWLVILFPMVGQ